MDSSFMFSVLFMILVLLSNVQAQALAAPSGARGGAKAPTGAVDITKFGAKPNADSTQALMSAWKEVCAAAGSSTLTVPKGTFVVGLVTMAGPCKGTVTFNLQGTLQAPVKVDTQGWIAFDHVDKLTINGGGTLDGQGKAMWSQPGCFKKGGKCESKAINLRLDFVNNSRVEGITSLNSKNFHINVLSCNTVTFQKVTITTPAESRDTNGIHIGRSKDITITDTNIGTGNDCVSVGDGTTNLKVTNTKCGPGHGISIGSLGLYENEAPVNGITVQGCTLTNTDNGCRIKSWPDKYASIASNINFIDITMENVSNPIIVDQMYCPSGGCNTQGPSKVKLTGISFKGIKGTTPTPEAIKLNCVAGNCEKVELANIDLKFTGARGPAKANCTNVKPTITGTVNPAGC